MGMVFVFFIAWLLLALIDTIGEGPVKLLKIIVIVAALIILILMQHGVPL